MPTFSEAQDRIDLIVQSIIEDLRNATLPQWALDLAYFSDRDAAGSAVDYPWLKVSGQLRAAPEGMQGERVPPKTYVTRVGNQRKQMSVPIPMSSLRRNSGAAYVSSMAQEQVKAGVNHLTGLIVDALANGGTYLAYDDLPFFSVDHVTGPNTAEADVANPLAPTEDELLSAVADAMVLIQAQREGEDFLNRGLQQYRVVMPFKYLKAANGLFSSVNIVEALKSTLGTEQRGRVDGTNVAYSLDPALSASEIFVAATDSNFKPLILQREYEDMQVLGIESDQAKKTGMGEFIFTQSSGIENWRYERIARIQLVTGA